MGQKLESNTGTTCGLPKNKYKYSVGKTRTRWNKISQNMFLKNHKYTKESHTK